MYILASDFFEKDDKYVLKAKNSSCNKDNYVHFYTRNLENTLYNFGTQYPLIFVFLRVFWAMFLEVRPLAAFRLIH